MSLSVAMRSLSVYVGLLTDERTGRGGGLIGKVSSGGAGRLVRQRAHMTLRKKSVDRLGDELSVRLPRHAGAIGQARKESEWLPELAPHLPLAIPVPVAVGEPDFGYPWPRAVSAGWTARSRPLRCRHTRLKPP
jgi:hypothetical protein